MTSISAPRRSSRLMLAGAWALVALFAVALAVQRYGDALSTGTGMDLEAFLAAAALARVGGDLYDADSYTYSPLLAWLLVPIAGSTHAMAIWTAVSLTAGAASVALVVATLWDRIAGWRAPVVAMVAVVTLFYSSMLSIELFLGQNQLLLLATIALAVLLGARRPVLAGIALGVAALIKTWPVLLWLWLIRAGAPHRVRAVLGALGTITALAVAMLSIDGFHSVLRLVERTFEKSEQPLGIYSVWFYARQWVPGADTAIPLSDAPVAGQVLSWLLAVGLIGLVALVLFRPGDRSLAMWNLTGATVLLLPVSHPFYQLLMLPLLWVWFAELLAATRKLEPAIAFGALGVWWIIAFRLEEPPGAGWLQLAVVTSTLVALTVSVVLAARRDRSVAPA